MGWCWPQDQQEKVWCGGHQQPKNESHPATNGRQHARAVWTEVHGMLLQVTGLSWIESKSVNDWRLIPNSVRHAPIHQHHEQHQRHHHLTYLKRFPRESVRNNNHIHQELSSKDLITTKCWDYRTANCLLCTFVVPLCSESLLSQVNPLRDSFLARHLVFLKKTSIFFFHLSMSPIPSLSSELTAILTMPPSLSSCNEWCCCNNHWIHFFLLNNKIMSPTTILIN